MIKEVVSEVMDDKLKILTNENQRLTRENTELRNRVCRLEALADETEQYSRRNSVRISNMPETRDENTDSLVLKVADVMGVDLSSRDIDRSHRIGQPGRKAHRDIIVKLTSYRARESLLKNRKNLKTSELHGVFIYEDLTKKRSAILYQARQLVKLRNPKLMGAWSSDGKLLVKDLNGKVCKISSMEDLEAYKTGMTSSDETQVKTQIKT